MKRAKKSPKGFSLLEAIIGLLLSGILLYVLSGWITFFSFATKKFSEMTNDPFLQNLVQIKKILNHIEYDLAPLKLNSSLRECTFAYQPQGFEGKKTPLVYAKIYLDQNRLFLEKRDQDNQLIELLPLLKKGENLKISLLGFLFQEQKNSFVEIEDLKPSDPFIPISIRFTTKNNRFDVDLPTLYDEKTLLSLHLSPTKEEMSCS